jgi:hypothetical protein
MNMKKLLSTFCLAAALLAAATAQKTTVVYMSKDSVVLQGGIDEHRALLAQLQPIRASYQTMLDNAGSDAMRADYARRQLKTIDARIAFHQDFIAGLQKKLASQTLTKH